MKTEKKLKVLKKIAAAFEHTHIIWAVGASALLYFKGLVSDFGDIDIVTAGEDVMKVKMALDNLGILKPENPDNRQKAQEYLEYLIDGVAVDIMADLIFLSDNRKYEFTLKKEDIKDYTMLEGIRVPLQSVEEWKNYYSLMGRTEKVRLINEKNGV